MTEETNSARGSNWRDLLAQHVEADQSALVDCCRQVLRENLFTNRAEIRPSILGRIAVEEVAALLEFLRASSPSLGMERGGQLCQLGLSAESVLCLSQAMRQFFITHLESSLVAPAVNLLDAYQNSVIRGFIQGREKMILSEQERIRRAFERTIA